jgi:hypothetical protein
MKTRWMALAAFQVLVMLGWTAQNEYVRATAPTFRIPLAPRDPYDILRGRYFVMNPKDGWLKTGTADVRLSESEVERFVGQEVSFSEPALVGFCPDGEVYRVCALAHLGEDPPPGPAQFWSRARRLSILHEETAWRDGKEVREPGYRVTVDLALDRFFLPNRATLPARENESGWAVEVSHRPGLTPLPRRLFFKDEPVVF